MFTHACYKRWLIKIQGNSAKWIELRAGEERRLTCGTFWTKTLRAFAGILKFPPLFFCPVVFLFCSFYFLFSVFSSSSPSLSTGFFRVLSPLCIFSVFSPLVRPSVFFACPFSLSSGFWSPVLVFVPSLSSLSSGSFYFPFSMFVALPLAFIKPEDAMRSPLDNEATL
jgi:hypothetical protein